MRQFVELSEAGVAIVSSHAGGNATADAVTRLPHVLQRPAADAAACADVG
ncbi:MAG: hypothetical protein KGK17_08395 [Betaproteobacteria bacterium]|nr:hypothetical protein [Betaproteobacteria bacterium]